MPFSLARYHELRRGLPAAGAGAEAVGAEVRYREVTGSTMDDARVGARGGAPCGTAYVGGHQTAGRGRQQRRWEGAEAAGLYVTFHLCPEAALRPWVAVLGALAAADAVAQETGLAVDLKWPNDLLVGGRKLAGVLAETAGDAGAPGASGDGTAVFLGIGINLRPVPDMPPEVAAIATNVEQAGAEPPPREALLAALAGALGRWCAVSPETVREEWRRRLVTLGQTVRLLPAGGAQDAVEGRAVDVGEGGALVLELPDGSRRSFNAGEVTTERPVVG